MFKAGSHKSRCRQYHNKSVHCKSFLPNTGALTRPATILICPNVREQHSASGKRTCRASSLAAMAPPIYMQHRSISMHVQVHDIQTYM